MLFSLIQIDEEPVATSGTPTSTGAKSTGATTRGENQAPAPGTPQTPPFSSSPLSGCAKVFFSLLNLSRRYIHALSN